MVWEGLEQSAGEERLSITYLCFMMVATMIAGIGVMRSTNPDCRGDGSGAGVWPACRILHRHRQPPADACHPRARHSRPRLRRRNGSRSDLTWILTALGLLDESMLVAERPLTSFIWKPDALSWIVGFLAGIAGMLAPPPSKSGALVGVLISVTTIPAAANAAVARLLGCPGLSGRQSSWSSTCPPLLSLERSPC